MLVNCHKCGDEIESRAKGTFQKVTGYAEPRTEGGLHHLKAKTWFPKYLCGPCAGIAEDHPALFPVDAEAADG